jgi:uncharacterized protein (TIGR00730 family)
MESVCVFCGSSGGANPGYREAARRLGEVLAESGITLVYGGGHVGLMGEVADAVLRAGGRVTGVIPRALMEREVGHRGLSDLMVVETMHQRKARMAELSDAFVALPGGVGTLEEFFEIWTWGQLGIHRKPYGLLNVAEYYTPLIGFLDHMVREGFVRAPHREMVLVDGDPRSLLERLRVYRPPEVVKWIDSSKT